MALWRFRGGEQGEHEEKFLREGRVYFTWEGLHGDLRSCSNRDEIRALLEKSYPTTPRDRITNYVGQAGAFRRMQPGDLLVMPRKGTGVVAVGEVASACEYAPGEEDRGYCNWRSVRWMNPELRRSSLDRDILAALSNQGTVCQVHAPNGESRVRSALGQRVAPPPAVQQVVHADQSGDTDSLDLEEVAHNRIADRIIATGKGHSLAVIVEEILQAKGFATYRSTEGPDDGVDIVAAPGQMGFGHPRICVQVKSGDAPLERSVLDQLRGVMRKCGADQGLLVSWGGFRRSFDRDERLGFFDVRLWDRDDLVDQFIAHYEGLPGDRRAEIPLKRVWTLAEDTES